MPDPTRGFYRKSGFWQIYDLPTEATLRVLEHLHRPGPPEPRLYTSANGYGSSSLSNAADAIGFPTRIDLTKPVFQKWIVLDQELTRAAKKGIRVYRIAKAGIEAIAQYQARKRYLEEHIKLAQRIIKECREAALARRNT